MNGRPLRFGRNGHPHHGPQGTVAKQYQEIASGCVIDRGSPIDTFLMPLVRSIGRAATSG